MAITVVHVAQTGTSAHGTLAVTSATAGNLLVVFIDQITTTSAPTGSDNISGTTGWTTNSTSALFSGSASSLFVAYKKAVGGETSLNPTVGSGGTLEGLSYFELSGIDTTPTIETIVHADNKVAVTTATSAAVTTSNPGDIVLICAGGNAVDSGTVNAWTGTGPATNVSTASTRCIGGYYIPGTTLSGATFTANWTSAKNTGVLALALQPVSSGNSSSGFFNFA